MCVCASHIPEPRWNIKHSRRSEVQRKTEDCGDIQSSDWHFCYMRSLALTTTRCLFKYTSIKAALLKHFTLWINLSICVESIFGMLSCTHNESLWINQRDTKLQSIELKFHNK